MPLSCGDAANDHQVARRRSRQPYVACFSRRRLQHRRIFVGLWLFSLGYLALQSGWFPRPLAVLLMVGCFAYLALAFTVPLLGGMPDTAVSLIAAPAGAAQLWMIGYLLTRGVNTANRQLPTPTPA